MKHYNAENNEISMFLSRVGIVLLIFLAFLGTSNAAVVNENYTNLYVEKEGWCADLEISFKVYNESDYGNKTEIEEGKDEDLYFRNISSADVTIYNGPLDTVPILIETTTNKTGQFEITFPSANQYLLFIQPEGNYNEYEEILTIEECEFADIEETNETVEEESEEEEESSEEEEESESEFEELLDSAEEGEDEIILNKSYSYLENKVTIDLADTDSTTATDLEVSEITIGELESKDITVLDNTLATVEIQADTSFDSATVAIEIENIVNVNKAFRYNSDSDTWTGVDSTLAGKSIFIETDEFGIFSVTGFLPPENLVVSEELSEEEPQSGLDALSSILPFALIGVFVILIVGGGGYFVYSKIAKKKKEADPLGSVTEKKIEEDDKVDEKEQQKLTTYNEVEEKTRNYVKQYKDKYSKDQIYRALTQAHVPKDIIDKVFLQMYD